MSFIPEVKRPEVEPGESLTGGWLAYHVQKGAPCHGHLFLTDRRLLFQPMEMGLAMKILMIVGATPIPEGAAWATSLRDVAGVTADPPASLAGQAGAYLHLAIRGGSTQDVFIAGDHAAALETIRRAIA